MTAFEVCLTQLQTLLQTENAALARMDLGAVAGLTGEKSRLVDLFRDLQWGPVAGVTPCDRKDRVKALDDLCGQNKQLLERAMIAQRRLLGIVLEASKPPVTIYSRHGGGGVDQAQPRAMVSRA